MAGPHAWPKERSSLARVGHALSTEVRRGRGLRRQDRRKTGNATVGREVCKNWRKNIDLASKVDVEEDSSPKLLSTIRTEMTSRVSLLA